MQFHPEVDLSIHGMEVLNNFLLRVCECRADFTVEKREVVCIQEIRQQAADKKVGHAERLSLSLAPTDDYLRGRGEGGSATLVARFQ